MYECDIFMKFDIFLFLLVDEALAADVDESVSFEERERSLLELLDKAYLLRHHVARIKRVKLIRYVIASDS